MRHYLIPVLLLSLLAGCAGVNIGPHRIDVQQGNALDQENVARLKPGLNRSQVRFLLGTPLVVDPFRTDRWDYVYVNYKSGKLAEQKRITLFFEGDTLARIEGDMPAVEPEVQTPVPPPAVLPQPRVESTTRPSVVAETAPDIASLVPQAAPAPVMVMPAAPAVQSPPVVQPPVAAAVPKPKLTEPSEPVTTTPSVQAATAVVPAVAKTARPSPEPVQAARHATSIVSPLPSPKNAPAYVDPRPPAELSLQPETDVTQIKPDIIPPFPEPNPVSAASDEPVLKSLNTWADAWARRDDEAYLAAYDVSFVPQGGGSRADWEKRRRLLLSVARNIDLKIDSPSVDRADDGTATVTFNQFYRSDSYRDAVVKQVRMTERDGRWLILEEKVLSILRGAKP